MGTHRRLGGYRLLDEIGRGSTAVVYLAMDAHGREVAVKELVPELTGEPEAISRLAREMSAQARVRSAYVARLLDGAVSAERPHVVMQYVPGCPLSDLVPAYGPLRADRLVRFARRLALALGDVHDAGVLHRDVSPGNVMVMGDRPTLIDFGIAHESGADQLTKRGLVVGTPAYLAPELIEGERATTASDVFSWAATVAYAATGRPPFGRGSLHGVCFRILRGQADIDGVPAPLAGLLRAAFARVPSERPPARWFAGALATPRDGVAA
ncbi:serine/threonine protein kinase [Actinomadura madurae]|uniref:serine/threonine-protein kinase n=1 Tax=Actinomadura madurae TaxID=1993 RepID=UPI0020261DFD|nr:serine/threonine-protein kinase [Actinomadura madurae]URM99779.1 serine/threonine protein kinase [Actinomadura madurae]URN01939.1 serine/threonine protein kinase [Actinomadura madurae]